MIYQLRVRKFAVAFVASAIMAGPVLATPGSGFVPSPVVNGHFGSVDVKSQSEKVGKWGMMLKTKDDTDIGADRLVVQPHGYSGWHSHPGPVFVTVTSGTVEWYDAALCTAHSYSAGQSYIEPAGSTHDVRNPSSTSTAEYIAIVIKPGGFVGPAFRLDEPQPNNCE